MDPANQAIGAMKAASEIASSSMARVFIDRVTGFKISTWEANGEVVRRKILDDYERAKVTGVDSIWEGSKLRHAANLINIAAKSTKYLSSEEQKIPAIDNDVFWNTVEHSKTVSDEEIQEILAQILAGEYNSRGSYTLHTLQIIKQLDGNLLRGFKDVLNLVIAESMIPEDVYNVDRGLEQRPDFGMFQTLQAIGLILPNSITHKVKKTQTISLPYQNKIIIFKTENPSDTLVRLPSYFALSPSGKQISKLLDTSFNTHYYEWLKKNYGIPGYSRGT